MRMHALEGVFCLLLVGCGSYFPPDRNVKEALAPADVAGAWKITPASLDLLTRDGFASTAADMYTITFKDDGTCLFQSVEDSHPSARYLEATGKWELQHDTLGGDNIRKKNVVCFEFVVAGAKHIHFLNFARENGSLILWTWHSDPDLWEFIEYKRAP